MSSTELSTAKLVCSSCIGRCVAVVVVVVVVVVVTQGEFQCLNRIEEGTYGVIYRAVDPKTGL